jgi:hypothetical protein
VAIHGIGDHAQFATTREIADYKVSTSRTRTNVFGWRAGAPHQQP